MNSTILIILFLIIFVGMIYVVMNEKENNIKEEARYEYTKPIGPTQEYPYRLDSRSIDG